MPKSKTPLSEKRFAMIATLARVAADSCNISDQSGEKRSHRKSTVSTPNDCKIKLSASTLAKRKCRIDNDISTAPRDADLGLGVFQKSGATGTKPFIEEWAEECGGAKVALECLQRFTSFPPGTLIKYAFPDEEVEWIWFIGAVRSELSRSDWHQVFFEDGDDLWVRLNAESREQQWNLVEVDQICRETSHLERSIERITPGASAQLRTDIRAAARAGCSRTSRPQKRR